MKRDKQEILRAMCDCIFESSSTKPVAETICSLMLQRISCMTGVLKQEDQRLIYEYIQQLATYLK